MNRLALGACIALALSACASAPEKSKSQAVALPDQGGVGRADLPPTHRKGSPYAPAQEDVGKRGNYTSGGLYAPHIQDSAPDDPLHDVDQIPEPDVVAEPRSRYGNRSPYKVLGKSYSVRDSAEGYVEQGQASYYGNKFHGRRTSNLEVYDMYALTAAHKTLPLPSFARVTNLENGKSVVVRVNDRGPFHAGRVIDLSYAAAVKLGYRSRGTARVEVRGLSAGENARERYDGVAKTPSPAPARTAPAELTLPPGVRIATGRPATLPAATQTTASTAMDRLVGMLPVAAANAGERPPQAESGSAMPAGNRAVAASAPVAAKPGTEWRFDMLQDGKAMTADEFDAWMKSRRARVATGKAGTPDPTGSAAPGSAVAAASSAAAPSPPTPQAAAARVAAVAPTGSGLVTLQVAAFANQQNAGQALAMLRDADIANARLLDASVNGKQVWRLRVGPVDAARAPELAARVVGLGFDQPQRVRE
jgi:rare lipoprotein A